MGDVTFWYQSSGCYSGDRNDYKVLNMWFKIVRTRQVAKTNPFLVRGSDQSLRYESDLDWDPLTDTCSHVPATSVYSEGGESVGLRDDSLSRQAGVTMPDASNIWGEIIYPY